MLQRLYVVLGLYVGKSLEAGIWNAQVQMMLQTEQWFGSTVRPEIKIKIGSYESVWHTVDTQ